jgi:lipid-binding SYLF domain-containing protein
VFVFATQEAFNNFVTSGRKAGANAMASAKTKTEGGALTGAVTVSKDVIMFQLNDEGAIVGVSLTAAKYYKDKELDSQGKHLVSRAANPDCAYGESVYKPIASRATFIAYKEAAWARTLDRSCYSYFWS